MNFNEKNISEEINETTLKDFIMLIDEIHKIFLSPASDTLNGYKKYTDSNKKVHMSKYLRNVLTFQRLYSTLDSIKDLGFALEYLNKNFELENQKAKRAFLEGIFTKS